MDNDSSIFDYFKNILSGGQQPRPIHVPKVKDQRLRQRKEIRTAEEQIKSKYAMTITEEDRDNPPALLDEAEFAS